MVGVFIPVGAILLERVRALRENIAELFKLAALLVFGALISLEFLADISWTGWVFAVPAIFVARPVALGLSFLRSGLDLREQAAAMWFGPKGFASVVHGLLVLPPTARRTGCGPARRSACRILDRTEARVRSGAVPEAIDHLACPCAVRAP